MGSSRRSSADQPGRPDDSRSTTRGPELGPARGLAGETLRGFIPFVGCASLVSGRSSTDVGVACGTGRAGR